MRRRTFLGVLSGAAMTWPLPAYSQQGERIRRIGVLIGAAADDRDAQARMAAFHAGLQQSGWIEGRNLQVEVRWGAGNANLHRRYASELAALSPDVILAGGS